MCIRDRPNARRFEYWEYNHAAWIGLGAAVDHALSIGLDRIEATVQTRADYLRESLAANGITCMDLGDNRSGIVTSVVPGIDAVDAKSALTERGINTSVSAPDSTLWDALRRDLPPMLRTSVHYITTNNEIDQLVAALVDIQP